MGQFASKAFDGDPYIDIMRALPDKELTWWIQKFLWLAEGITILSHAGRTYREILIHKCPECDGAGIVTCPHCNGYKVRRVNPQAFRLPQQQQNSRVAKLLASANLQECENCGGYCPWDAESEWQEKWNDWESKLAYYDRTYGALMDEWYEDVVHEGRLDEDTQPGEEVEPQQDDMRIQSQASREILKDKKRMKALMRRMGGHPYENADVLPFKTIDPSKPLAENIEALGYNFLELPPELHPESFPELLIAGADSPLHKFDNEIRMEYLIMSNLDAAIRGAQKPVQFGPSAGTVSCPCCKGQAWGMHWIPNLGRLLNVEQPYWMRTLSSMAPYWQQYSISEGDPSYSPWLSPALAGAPSGGASTSSPSSSSAAGLDSSSSSSSRRRRRWVGEVPTQPPLIASQAQLQAAEQALAPGPVPTLPPNVAQAMGALSPNGQLNYGKVATRLLGSLPSAPTHTHDWDTRALPDADEVQSVLQQLRGVAVPAGKQSGGTGSSNGKGPKSYGPQDPLSPLPAEALSPEQVAQVVSGTSGGPLIPGGERLAEARFRVMDALNPTRQAARQLRDARQLGVGESPEEKELLLKWAAARGLPAAAGTS